MKYFPNDDETQDTARRNTCGTALAPIPAQKSLSDNKIRAKARGLIVINPVQLATSSDRALLELARATHFTRLCSRLPKCYKQGLQPAIA